jgi:hypothetical protein
MRSSAGPQKLDTPRAAPFALLRPIRTLDAGTTATDSMLSQQAGFTCGIVRL